MISLTDDDQMLVNRGHQTKAAGLRILTCMSLGWRLIARFRLMMILKLLLDLTLCRSREYMHAQCD